MAVGLSFQKANKTDAATDLSEIQFVTLEDSVGNKYTLDITGSELKLGYKPSSGSAIEHTVTSLATALGSLLGTKEGEKSLLVHELGKALSGTQADYDDSSNGANDQTPLDFLVEKGKLITEGNLKTEVVKPDFVDVLVPALSTVGTGDANQVYTKEAAKTELAAKVDVLGANATETGVEAMLAKITTADKKVVQVSDLKTKSIAEALLGAKDGEKLVLVTELGKALDLNDPSNAAHKVYGSPSQEKIAKDFLGEKGLKGADGAAGAAGATGAPGATGASPTATEVAAEVAANSTLQDALAGNAALQGSLAGNSDLQAAVRSALTMQVNADNTEFQGAVHKIMSFDYISDDPAYWSA